MANNRNFSLSLNNTLWDIDVEILLIKVSVTIFLASIFFSGIIKGSPLIRNAALCSALLISFLRAIRRRRKFKLTIVGVFILLFLCFVVVNRGKAFLNGEGISWLVVFSLTAVLGVMLKLDSDEWFFYIAKLVAVFGLIHALATITFLFIPGFYSGWFKPHFYAGVITANDYKSGLTSHYSMNGMYLAWGLISSFFLSQLSAARNNKQWAVFSMIILIGLLATTKRAHLAFGLVACLVMYILFNRESGSFGVLFKLCIVVVLLLLVLYFVSLYIPAISAVLDRFQGMSDDETFGGRSDYYSICIEMWKENPLTGHGWGSFTQTLYQSGISDLKRLYFAGNLTQKAHNVYLQLLAEEGGLGLLLFFILAFTGVARAVLWGAEKRAAEQKMDRADSLGILSVGVQVFFLMYCITGNPLYDLVEYSIYLLLGLSYVAATPLCKAASCLDAFHL